MRYICLVCLRFGLNVNGRLAWFAQPKSQRSNLTAAALIRRRVDGEATKCYKPSWGAISYVSMSTRRYSMIDFVINRPFCCRWALGSLQCIWLSGSDRFHKVTNEQSGVGTEIVRFVCLFALAALVALVFVFFRAGISHWLFAICLRQSAGELDRLTFCQTFEWSEFN